MDQASLQHHWDAFYRDNHTGCGSGLGSLISSTADYRHLLENFIRLNRPERVLDLGCGDWQSTKLSLATISAAVAHPSALHRLLRARAAYRP